MLSFLNLAGAFLALTAFGGLEEWSDSQFVGLFGLLEAPMGVAYIVCPNIWRLPVAEANTRRADIRLTPATVLLPHWIAAAKAVAGGGMLGAAAWHEGIASGAALLPLVGIAIAGGTVAFSLVVARLGVAWPQADVFWIVVRRPGQAEVELPGMSIGGTIVQFLTNITVFPAVKLIPPSALFQPGITASSGLVIWSLVFAIGALLLALLAWGTRLAWQPAREQLREAEAEFFGSSDR